MGLYFELSILIYLLCWVIQEQLENPTILVSGHHGKLHIEGLRFIIDESGGLEHLPIAAIVFPSQQIVRDHES